MNINEKIKKYLNEDLDSPDIQTIKNEIKLKHIDTCHICDFAIHSEEALECKNPQVMKIAKTNKYLDTYSWVVCKFFRG